MAAWHTRFQVFKWIFAGIDLTTFDHCRSQIAVVGRGI
jgi:hypothetical protein